MKRLAFVDDGDIEWLARLSVGRFVPQANREQLLASGGIGERGDALIFRGIDGRTGDWRANGNDFVKPRHRVSGADFARVLAVVLEILGAEEAILVAEQPVT